MSVESPFRAAMVLISLGQGLLLYLLYRAFANDVWPAGDPPWALLLLTLAMAVPLTALLTLGTGNAVRLALGLGVFSLVLAIMAAWTGWQATPAGRVVPHGLYSAFALTTAIALFKGLMYLQLWLSRAPLEYALLFSYSWRNFLTVALALVVVAAVQLILFLWGALFAVVGIEFFQDLFSNNWIRLPVLAVSFGLAVDAFRRLTGVIDGITSLLRGGARLLLPMVVLITLLFVGTIPIVGLEPLWATRRGTAVLLWLAALTLFFVNAVYQADKERPLSGWLHLGITVGLVALPVLVVLAGYGLWLRVDQYGWTVERCWAGVVTILLGAFASAYAYGVVRRGSAWPATLARANARLGLGVLLVMVLTNTPLLDFRSLSLASQIARVEAGGNEQEAFDFEYAVRHLGRPGYLHTQSQLDTLADADSAFGRRLRRLLQRSPEEPESDEAIWARVTVRPADAEVPVGLRTLILKTYGRRLDASLAVIAMDLNEDERDEFVVFSCGSASRCNHRLFVSEAGEWKFRASSLKGGNYEKLNAAVVNGEPFERVAPEYQDLRIGDLVIQVQ